MCWISKKNDRITKALKLTVDRGVHPVFVLGCIAQDVMHFFENMYYFLMRVEFKKKIKATYMYNL